jgi:O-antigen/teichoic acid export membrane protein
MLLGQLAAYALKIVYFIAIARLLGVVQYGLVVGAYALINLVAHYCRLGMGTVLLRYVSPNHDRFAAYWGNLLLVTTAMGAIVLPILRLLAPNILDRASAEIVVATAVSCCLFEQITMSATQAFQAFQRMPIAAVLSQLTPLLRAIAAIGMLLTVHHANARQWTVALMVSSAVAAVIAFTTVTIRLGWPQLKPYLIPSQCREGAWYAFSASTESAYNDIDKTMLSHYGMSAANGIYGIAYRIIDMGCVPIASIQQAADPRLFQLAADGPREPIRLGKRLLKHGVAVAAISAVAMFLCAPLVPSLAGRQFAAAVSALRWLCLIPILRSVHGITGNVLTSLGLQRYRTSTQVAAAVLNLGLNAWLIPRFGWHGAAWASLLTDGTLGLSNWCVLAVVGKNLMGEIAGADYACMYGK